MPDRYGSHQVFHALRANGYEQVVSKTDMSDICMLLDPNRGGYKTALHPLILPESEKPPLHSEIGSIVPASTLKRAS
jgi:hypothetical protein